MPGATSEKWLRGYETLVEVWKSLGRPEESFEFSGNTYQVRYEHEMSKEFPDDPAFFHNHGALFLPYQEELHWDRTPYRVVIGGFGSGKTRGMVQSMLVHGVTLAGFRAFVLAPFSKQAEEFYKIAMDLISGTLFEERFLVSTKLRPYPQIEMGHADIGTTTIECFPLGGSDAVNLRTLTGDLAVIDQAEDNSLDLAEIMRSLGTRFRGRVPRTGRGRIGTITFLANSGDNQQLWDLYDEAEHDPQNYRSWNPSSYDNPYLTDADLRRFEKSVGNTEESRKQWLYAKRPLGNGQHFSRAVLESMREESLDQVMHQGLEEQERSGNHLGYVMQEARGVGVYEWLLPPLEDREYLVISDPGTKNPPHRDSPPILVWDITNFPGTRETPVPAFMVGFVWVFGNNNIQNWANRYAEIVYRYKAIGRNGFDATGYQSGYDQWLTMLMGLMPEKISLAGNNKALSLNSAKILTANQMVKTPKRVSAIYEQLARYEYPPEPKNLRQDVTMAFIMSCWWMQRLYYIERGADEGYESQHDPMDRFPIASDRYRENVR